jgi:DNA-binding beta-propeller fold protein YncE
MATATQTRLSVQTGITALLTAVSLAAPSHAQPGAALRPPTFEVDSDWPTVPNDWVLGEVSSIAVGNDDHVWLLHRPRSIPEELRNRAAPPVLEFDADGRLLSSWGGAGDGYDWPEREHGIWVAASGSVWISGNGGWPRPAADGSTDDMILKFSPTGEFLLQIGRRGASQGNGDTVNLHQPADLFVHEATNELYVADGYGNQRVIVFDADSGSFKRMWGAFGADPAGGEDSAAPSINADTGSSAQFGLVHAVKVSNDGIVYVADRGNQRLQWFTTAGRYISELVIEGAAPPAPAGFAFSPDPRQEFLYVVESANARVLVFDRAAMNLVHSFGSRTAEPGGMDIAHHIAVDSVGNLYTAEIVNNRRAQKFLLAD